MKTLLQPCVLVVLLYIYVYESCWDVTIVKRTIYIIALFILIESGGEIEADDSLPGPSKAKPIAQTSSVNAFTLISSVMKTGESPKFLSDRLVIPLVIYCKCNMVIYIGTAS